MCDLKIGDVVYLPSNPEILMTVYSIISAERIRERDVDVVYFNGGIVIKERIKYGALVLASEVSDKDYVIGVLRGLAEKQLEMLQKLVDADRSL